MSLEDLLRVIQHLKEKVETHRGLLTQSEALTRYALIDPLLRALGWNTEDPEQVRPEFSTDVGRPDYALLVEGKPHIFVGAKPLGKDEDLDKLATYSVNQGVPYFVRTDGARWEVYNTFKPVRLPEKKIAEWDLCSMEAGEIARQALALWKPIASREPLSAPAPLIQAPKQLKKATSGSSLQDVKFVAGQKPPFSRLIFPDGQEYPIGHWKDLLKQAVAWLYNTGRLTTSRCPITCGRKRNLVHTQSKHQDGSSFFSPVQVGPFYVETHYSAKSCKELTIRLLKQFEIEPDQLKVNS
jgi:hypothetical protein